MNELMNQQGRYRAARAAKNYGFEGGCHPLPSSGRKSAVLKKTQEKGPKDKNGKRDQHKMEKELKDHFFKEREKGSEEKKKEPKQRTKKMVIPTIFAVATLRNLNNCFEHKSKMF